MTILLLQTRYYISIFKGIRFYSNTINFDTFLTEKCLDKCIHKFSRIQGLEEWKHLKKEASVLIPLCHVNNEVSLLYTMRTTQLRRHSGQVAFPGGMRDDNETAEETATRETEEEVGIPRGSIRTYGCGSPVGRHNVKITPVVGYVGSVTASNLKINPSEVQLAFTLPLSKFCDPSCCRYTVFRSGYTLPAFVIDNHRVWGITAYLTHVFLQCLLGETYKFNIKSFTNT